MIRPVLKGTGAGVYECPSGYKACNEDFFDVEGGENFVVCTPLSEDEDLSCPITSIAFEVP